MSTPWPAFVAQNNVPSVERIDNNLTFGSLGGQETDLNLGPEKFRYTFHYNALRLAAGTAPSPWSAYSEVGCVFYLMGLGPGTLGRFTFTDPITGSTVTCKLAKNSNPLEADPDGAPWYTGDVTFITAL
jgi:hypothetical protein